MEPSGGQNAIGVAAAERACSSTETVGELTLPQSALLAGLPQAPSEYNPFDDPAAATRKRRNEVHFEKKMAQAALHQPGDRQLCPAIAESAGGVHHSDYYTLRPARELLLRLRDPGARRALRP